MITHTCGYNPFDIVDRFTRCTRSCPAYIPTLADLRDEVARAFDARRDAELRLIKALAHDDPSLLAANERAQKTCAGLLAHHINAGLLCSALQRAADKGTEADALSRAPRETRGCGFLGCDDSQCPGTRAAHGYDD